MSPTVLLGTEIILRPMRYRDRKKWNRVRVENREWLTPWEATLPTIPVGNPAHESGDPRPTFFEMVGNLKQEAKAGRSYSFLIWKDANLVGQITMGGVMFGAMRGAHIGYWIDRNFANRGYTTEAVKLVSEFGFHQLGLHRIEINIRPENDASCRVAEKAGFEFEGFRKGYLHIDGAWRDHKCFVKTNELIQ
ncbi:MAG: GNAT family protein [Actinobacteria bacterium]|jgi:ribosomal-protein-alanine N-acetyltransferase|nr:GNAT family protein [Actinomycetota bacterium]